MRHRSISAPLAVTLGSRMQFINHCFIPDCCRRKYLYHIESMLVLNKILIYEYMRTCAIHCVNRLEIECTETTSKGLTEMISNKVNIIFDFGGEVELCLSVAPHSLYFSTLSTITLITSSATTSLFSLSLSSFPLSALYTHPSLTTTTATTTYHPLSTPKQYSLLYLHHGRRSQGMYLLHNHRHLPSLTTIYSAYIHFAFELVSSMQLYVHQATTRRPAHALS